MSLTGKKLKLKVFDPKVIEEKRMNPKQGPATILLVGSKRTGKSTLIEALMRIFRRIPKGMIITGSQSSAERFSKFFPKSCIYDCLDDRLVQQIGSVIKKQEKLNKSKVRGDYSSLLLFDDCGYDQKFSRSQILKKLFMNGRHYKILIIMAIQYARSIPPDLRNNADYVFILRDPSIDGRKKLHKDYAGIIHDFKMFCKIMDKCTSDYGCLVIDKTTSSNEIEDNIFYYKAKLSNKPFKVGSKQLWDFHNKYYRSDDEDDNCEDEDVIIKKSTKR